jgi:hypothetical protein
MQVRRFSPSRLARWSRPGQDAIGLAARLTFD